MIISASRRTDLPAFYTPWLLNRIEAGFCQWTNPYNPNQIKRIDLRPHAVDAFVFWSKNPKPLLAQLPKLDKWGYLYYFQYTLNNYPELEPNLPKLSQRLATFRQLSERIGPGRVVWRYDPIIISNKTPFRFHLETFSKLSQALEGATERVMISFFDPYPKLKRRLARLKETCKIEIVDPLVNPKDKKLLEFGHTLAQLAKERGMEIFTCSEPLDPALFGIEHGACIDEKLLAAIGAPVMLPKDRSQRKDCLCRSAIDLGIYNTCPHNCSYCYANGKEETVARKVSLHNPKSVFLIPQ